MEAARATRPQAARTMRALVFRGPGRRALEDKPRPVVKDATDAIVRGTTSTICGTDLHILKGDVPTVTDGRTLGHEGVGIVEEVGTAVANVGVHGKPASLHLETLWAHNVTLTTRLVDAVTTPTLLKLVGAGRLEPAKLVTHRFPLAEVMRAYDTFANAARERALKVILRNA